MYATKQDTKDRLACLDYRVSNSLKPLPGNRAVAGDHAKKAAGLHGIGLECSYLGKRGISSSSRLDFGDLTGDLALKKN